MAAKRRSIVCWGEVLWDLFPSGAKLGGAVANVAFHLAQLGERPCLISRVGDDELGHRAIADLRRAGVDTSLIQVDDQRQTGTVTVDIDDGEPRYSLSSGCAWEHIHCGHGELRAIEDADTLCVGTLAQRNPSGRTALESAVNAARNETTIIVDANIRPVHLEWTWLERLLKKATIVKVNESEAALVERVIAHGDPSTWLLEQPNIDLVALTLGNKGCRLINRDAIVDHPGFQAATGGDNVGAGDAFLAVLVVGAGANWPLATIAERANRYAAFVASSIGATPTADQALIRDLVAAPPVEPRLD